MSLVVEGQTYEWEGGTLEELLGLIAEAALSVRVEALQADRDEKLGEIHVVAGGVSDTLAGERRGDSAMAHLRQIPGMRFLVHPMLPNPDDGSLTPAGPLEGTLEQRPPPTVMRYCEDFVLTCALEMRRGEDQVRVSYRRGEILRTLVNGSESGERLPEVMGWTDGTWRIILPQLALPRPPKPTRPQRAPAVDSGTLFGYQVQPLPIPATPVAPVSGNGEPVPTRAAAPFAVSPSPSPSQLRRSTDGSTPRVETGIRVTPVLTAVAVPTALPVVVPAAAPDPVAAARKLDTTLPTAPARAATTQPADSRPGMGSWIASLLFHALLGVALGLAIVGGYWAFLRWGSSLRLG